MYYEHSFKTTEPLLAESANIWRIRYGIAVQAVSDGMFYPNEV